MWRILNTQLYWSPPLFMWRLPAGNNGTGLVRHSWGEKEILSRALISSPIATLTWRHNHFCCVKGFFANTLYSFYGFISCVYHKPKWTVRVCLGLFKMPKLLIHLGPPAFLQFVSLRLCLLVPVSVFSAGYFLAILSKGYNSRVPNDAPYAMHYVLSRVVYTFFKVILSFNIRLW